MLNKRPGSTKGKQSVVISSSQGKRDTKFEGYSNLQGDREKQQQREAKGKESEVTKELEEDYILNLQKQIVIMERQIQNLKQREIDQKNQASGYETLLRDGIPLNEHFLALKNKFNNEKDGLEKNAVLMDEEIKKKEHENKKKQNNIVTLKREYEEESQLFQD